MTKKRNRLTKEELIGCGYYEWLKAASQLRSKKKEGVKLTPQEKKVLRTKPRPGNPWHEIIGDSTESTVTKSDRKKKPGEELLFGPEKVFKTSGAGASAWFFCEVHGMPRRDENCLLTCKTNNCPFIGKGYFRTKGVKF